YQFANCTCVLITFPCLQLLWAGRRVRSKCF
ncbi:hypothetical protein DBR06_SOUSAS8210214, partial [Sousa chinensis]